MIPLKEKIIYNQALEKFGQPAQVLQLAEEFGELISALNKDLRSRGDIQHIRSEIADCQIMINQMVNMYFDDDDQFQKIFEIKLEKLQGYLD